MSLALRRAPPRARPRPPRGCARGRAGPRRGAAWACSAASSRIRAGGLLGLGAASLELGARARRAARRSPRRPRRSRRSASRIASALASADSERGVADDPLGGRLGLGADLGRRFAGRGEDARGLLAEDLEQHGVVGSVGQRRGGPRPARPAGGARSPPAAGARPGPRPRAGRPAPPAARSPADPPRRADGRCSGCRAGRPWHPDGRTDPRVLRGRPPVHAALSVRGQQRAHISAQRFERLQRLVQGVDRDHLDVVPDGLLHLLELVGRHEEHLVARVSHGEAPSARRRRPGPTVPSSSIVPVTATLCPPVSSPGVSTSRTASVKARPADGPPTVARVDGHVDREVERRDAVLRVDADDRAVGVVGRRDGRHVHVDAGVAPRRSLDREGVGRARDRRAGGASPTSPVSSTGSPSTATITSSSSSASAAGESSAMPRTIAPVVRDRRRPRRAGRARRRSRSSLEVSISSAL